MLNVLCRMFAFLILFSFPAKAHDPYTGWASQKTSNCCSNQDCDVLPAEDIRQTSNGTEVRVGVEWCSVRGEHYVIKGKSPDFTVHHACINKNPDATFANVCDRLLCFMGNGGL
mgnify:CR=1 FL=1